ncbi:diguanylate cyclase [Paenibacillus yonginensis]|uniref:Diguanylate cyclase n=1 Tax=Paenibacillus yonginensis TaxID=1462996 RepID=A0A1B1MYX4_9BACL|nr:EAL domain-containing protein [Paenibacillus yonginensis]ANS74349.1 diguanylate cyclase [Paenibacillus yonginensis]
MKKPLFPAMDKSGLYNYMTYFYHNTRRSLLAYKRFDELQRIVRGKKLTTYFQPIFHLQKNDCLGFEVLNRPTVSSHFPTTESFYDFIGQTDQVFAFERFCRELSLERFNLAADEGHKRAAVIFLNVHPEVLSDANYRSGETLHLLSRFGFTPEQIVFELTERQAVQDYDAFERVLSHYRSQGFRIAIDDAGSGYNSLKAIVSLKPEFIKLDKSLIRDVHVQPNQRKVVKLLQEFAEASGTHIIAEGIESREEISYLRSEGIEFGQGYALGRPETSLQSVPLSFAPI